jgi:hypothetical protein
MFQHNIWLGVLFGLGGLKASFVAGVVLALVPLGLGPSLGRARFGRRTAVITIGANVVGGALFGLPVCLALAADIVRRWEQDRAKAKSVAGCRVRDMDRASKND